MLKPTIKKLYVRMYKKQEFSLLGTLHLTPGLMFISNICNFGRELIKQTRAFYDALIEPDYYVY